MELQTNQELEHAPVALIESVRALKVVDVVTYAQAGEFGKTIKAEIEKREQYFEPMRVKAKASYDEVLKMKKEAITPLEVVVAALRLSMNSYNEEQKRLERIEQARLQAIADEEARKEREKLLAAAIKAEAAGKLEKAEEKFEQAEMVYAAPVTVAPTVAKTVATAAGNITQAKEVNVTVTDMKAFVSALIAQYPGALQMVLDVKAGPLKSWTKNNGLETFPGLNIVKTTGVRF